MAGLGLNPKDLNSSSRRSGVEGEPLHKRIYIYIYIYIYIGIYSSIYLFMCICICTHCEMKVLANKHEWTYMTDIECLYT